MTRKQIIHQHIRQKDIFKVLRLTFHKMIQREHHLIEKLGLKRPVNAATLDSLAIDLHYLDTNYRLVKK